MTDSREKIATLLDESDWAVEIIESEWAENTPSRLREAAAAVRSSLAAERRVSGWAVVNMRTGAPLTFYYSEEVARDACRPLFSEAHKVVPCEVILHDAPGEEGGE